MRLALLTILLFHFDACHANFCISAALPLLLSGSPAFWPCHVIKRFYLRLCRTLIGHVKCKISFSQKTRNVSINEIYLIFSQSGYPYFSIYENDFAVDYR